MQCHVDAEDTVPREGRRTRVECQMGRAIREEQERKGGGYDRKEGVAMKAEGGRWRTDRQLWPPVSRDAGL